MKYFKKILSCHECGKKFAFSALKQESFHRRHLTHEPKRCPSCQAAGKKDTRLPTVKITN